MFLISSLTLHVRLSRRWAFFYQSLTQINIAVQQLDEVGREVKLWSHIGGGHYVSVTSGFPCLDFRKWFQPRDQKDPKPTRKGIVLNLDQWVRMRKIVEAINNDHPVLAEALPCYMQDGHLATFECRECYPFLNSHKVFQPIPPGTISKETQTLCRMHVDSAMLMSSSS